MRIIKKRPVSLKEEEGLFYFTLYYLVRDTIKRLIKKISLFLYGY